MINLIILDSCKMRLYKVTLKKKKPDHSTKEVLVVNK